jgi:endoglucanase
VVVALAACSVSSIAAEPSTKSRWLPASSEKLPRWRGFNLLEKFLLNRGHRPFHEEDFRLISKLGFNFVRLPMDYRFWIKDGAWEKFDEKALVEIDQAVAWGEKYGIHVCINFHRAPGYTVAKPPERTDLWTDAEPLRVCAKHWAMFARRYKGIPNTRISFDLVNEPGKIDTKAYVAVVRKLADAIRAEDPERLIIADGLEWGQMPVPALAEFYIAQATRGYAPAEISHYKASWVHSENFPPPQWPRDLPNGTRQDRDWLWKHSIEPWKNLERQGSGVMVGEWGVYKYTPHDVVLRWAEDCLANWKRAGWGWAMWNFRGDMGVVDSRRSDVRYEDFEGHKLDRKMMDLLQRY